MHLDVAYYYELIASSHNVSHIACGSFSIHVGHHHSTGVSSRWSKPSLFGIGRKNDTAKLRFGCKEKEGAIRATGGKTSHWHEASSLTLPVTGRGVQTGTVLVLDRPNQEYGNGYTILNNSRQIFKNNKKDPNILLNLSKSKQFIY